MKYTQAYENSLHCSPRFQEYATSLATGLIDRYSLRGKDIIEIGCGKGEFLTLLCEMGGNRGVGFDPSYDGRSDGGEVAESVTFMSDFYSEKYSEYTADLICCRHVLEHVQDPRDFLLKVRRAIGDRQDTVLFFEVPNVLYTLGDLGIWDIIYEHCSYFSAPSLTRAFQESGFTPHQVYPAFEGQFLCLEGSPRAAEPCGGTESAQEVDKLSTLVSKFAAAYRQKVGGWNGRLRHILDQGSRIVLWGAGSKGVTFLNTVKAADQIGYVVDINPHKQGMYVAGTGQRIVSPEYLGEYRPDAVVVMNPIYKDEITELISRVGLSAEVNAV